MSRPSTKQLVFLTALADHQKVAIRDMTGMWRVSGMSYNLSPLLPPTAMLKMQRAGWMKLVPPARAELQESPELAEAIEEFRQLPPGVTGLRANGKKREKRSENTATDGAA